MAQYACIKALAVYLPEQIEKNDMGDERFIAKLGIEERHIAGDTESSGDLAVAAAESLFGQYAIPRESIEFILLCTQHPDYLGPTTACHVQSRLGIPETSGALDYSLGCSGYVYASVIFFMFM